MVGRSNGANAYTILGGALNVTRVASIPEQDQRMVNVFDLNGDSGCLALPGRQVRARLATSSEMTCSLPMLC